MDGADYEIQFIRGKLPHQGSEIQFTNRRTLLGEMALRNNHDKSATARLKQKENGGWLK